MNGKEETGISKSPIFTDLPREKLAEVYKVVQKDVLPAHQVIFRQGDPGDRFYVITSGSVRIFRKSEDGIETDLSRLGPGDSFGEMALLTQKPRSANAQTLEETQLLVLAKDQFDRVLKRPVKLHRHRNSDNL
jgi:CRP/FNR family transcriptional regulator, cyclic AMP receptor protein